MTWCACSAASLALALLVAPSPSLWLLRVRPQPVCVPGASRRTARLDQLGLAASYDLLAVSLRAGLPTSVAMRAVAQSAPEPLAGALAKAASLLALGAGPRTAWEEAAALEVTAPLARMAIRSARSGTALAEGLGELASGARAEALDQAAAEASRAAVLLAGPLGLCFLPAFFCLGVMPVIVGLGSGVMRDAW
ncbi:Type II secretion system F domain protein [Segniliparus rotundus DSM 44985]|uniref:Type II secretion system F domain protein n=1 Tax=Segniliparus rotundus (strain ATCC BAA-972 / CDC 1076 / CIP 108378 / DSM 44985 / JCM 13578) TaxID=640132 RepID=D6ZC73_SEGRD|nr:type II secretion system F family protein [Segniliparus rotundus]ADG99042.1 Type II secretion system F domain protein [Segniliparus rotundus DSM 44985]